MFGKEISQNYATIELTISNRSSEASLIVHSIFIDYSAWALSGSSQNHNAKGNEQHPWQAQTSNNQISSVEYRVARGQLLDRQPWTFRNILIRSLQATGSIASAYVFATTNTDIVRGINGFNGQGIPAAQALLPDGTVGQMNRISDFGFQVNKVIPKDSSDIVVAFFPIDRFLTPGLKKLFLKSPALFFAPGALALDKKAGALLKPDFEYLLGSKAKAQSLLHQLPLAYVNYIAGNEKVRSVEKSVDDKTCDPDCVHTAMLFLASASLNNVRVIAGGTMTVDVGSVPASISAIEMDEGNDKASSFKKGEHRGVIRGSFLLNGTPALVGDGSDAKLAITKEGSTDKELHFTMTLGSDLDATKVPKLTFKVIKKDKNGQDVDSTTKDLLVVAPSQISGPGSAPVTTPANPIEPTPVPQQPPLPKSVTPRDTSACCPEAARCRSNENRSSSK